MAVMLAVDGEGAGVEQVAGAGNDRVDGAEGDGEGLGAVGEAADGFFARKPEEKPPNCLMGFLVGFGAVEEEARDCEVDGIGDEAAALTTGVDANAAGGAGASCSSVPSCAFSSSPPASSSFSSSSRIDLVSNDGSKVEDGGGLGEGLETDDWGERVAVAVAGEGEVEGTFKGST